MENEENETIQCNHEGVGEKEIRLWDNKNRRRHKVFFILEDAPMCMCACGSPNNAQPPKPVPFRIVVVAYDSLSFLGRCCCSPSPLSLLLLLPRVIIIILILTFLHNTICWRWSVEPLQKVPYLTSLRPPILLHFGRSDRMFASWNTLHSAARNLWNSKHKSLCELINLSSEINKMYSMRCLFVLSRHAIHTNWNA